MTDYEAIIGLETHIQLNTKTKIFCACKTDSWFDPPNSNICPVCTGLPGVLPVLNRAAVEKAVILAAAMHADIQSVSYFDRKNYFYPDLPKGYQISQYFVPIAIGGYLDLPMPEGDIRRVNIHKLHIEEDAGKTKVERGKRLLDFNRCGVPLIEMVTQPDLRSAEEAMQYLIRLRQLVRWLGISDGDMERAHLRCDANVSIRPKGADYLNPKTEIKNVNSMVSLRDAIQAEVARQIREVEKGNAIETWTLDWDEETQTLRKMRSKETEADYRYFREPDLLPIIISDEWRSAILSKVPELPLERKARFIEQFGLPEYDADILTSERSLSEYFEAAVGLYQKDAKRVSNWLINDVMRLLNESGKQANELRLVPRFLVEIIQLVDDNTVNVPTGKTLISRVEQSGESPAEIVRTEGLGMVSDADAIRHICAEVLAENPEPVENYKKGKTTILGWFVGQAMKKSRGKADPEMVRAIFEELLKE